MKEIKVTETVEKVVGYEAIDGRRFDDESECIKYDKTAGAVITAEFKKRVLKEMLVSEITDSGNLALCEYGDDSYVALVKITDQYDLNACNMYCQHVRSQQLFTNDMIGNEVLVHIGYGSINGGCCYDNSWVYGTIDECIEKYRKGLLKMYEINDTDTN